MGSQLRGTRLFVTVNSICTFQSPLKFFSIVQLKYIACNKAIIKNIDENIIKYASTYCLKYGACNKAIIKNIGENIIKYASTNHEFKTMGTMIWK